MVSFDLGQGTLVSIGRLLVMWVFPRLKRAAEYSYLLLIWTSFSRPAHKNLLPGNFPPVFLVSVCHQRSQGFSAKTRGVLSKSSEFLVCDPWHGI